MQTLQTTGTLSVPMPLISTELFPKLFKFDKIKQCHEDKQYITPGNITPSWWYSEFKDNKGNPDLIIINILAEIVYQYRAKPIIDYVTNKVTYIPPFAEEAWYTSYSHFEQKLNFKETTTRRALRKLEERDIIIRETKNIILDNGDRRNKLVIHLNQEFFELCFVNQDLDIRAEHVKYTENSNFTPSIPVSMPPCHQLQGPISNKINNNNRSSESSFCNENNSGISTENIEVIKTKKMVSEESGDVLFSVETSQQGEIVQTIPLEARLEPIKTNRTKQPFSVFYPLSILDCDYLQEESETGFSLDKMNVKLLAISKKYQNGKFYSKKDFLAYMVKVFSNMKEDSNIAPPEGRSVEINQSMASAPVHTPEEESPPINLKRKRIPLLDWIISKEDCTYLQRESGREFTQNAMQEITKNMGTRLKNVGFWTKKLFLNYMVKALRYEKRQAVQTQGQDFRIKANLTAKDKQNRAQEKHLNEVEQQAITHVCQESQLKAKLAGRLEEGKAYRLLSNLKRFTIVGEVMQIHLSRQLELTENDKEIILSQVQAVYSTARGENIECVESVEFVVTGRAATTGKVVKFEKPKAEAVELPEGVWGDIRKALITEYGVDADRNWFSKLTAEIDEKAKTIELKCHSEFVKDWVQEKYMLCMKNVANKLNISTLDLV